MKKNPLFDILTRTSTDKAFREEFLRDPAGVLRRSGIQTPEGKTIVVHENSDDEMFLVIPSGAEDQPAKWAQQEQPAAGEKKEAPGLTLEWDEEALVLKGSIDSANARFLREQLNRVSGDLTIDFSEVAYMGSLGLSMLIEAQKRLQADQRMISLFNVSDQIKNVFAVTNTDSFFQFVDPYDFVYLPPPCV